MKYEVLKIEPTTQTGPSLQEALRSAMRDFSAVHGNLPNCRFRPIADFDGHRGEWPVEPKEDKISTI